MLYDFMLRARITRSMRWKIEDILQEQRMYLQDPTWGVSDFIRDLLMERIYPGHKSVLTEMEMCKRNTRTEIPAP